MTDRLSRLRSHMIEDRTRTNTRRADPQPFFKKGSQEFAIALRLATPEEKPMWVRFGIAQFKPDDPRLKKIEDGVKSKRMSGEAA